jgi:hypothetical protein
MAAVAEQLSFEATRATVCFMADCGHSRSENASIRCLIWHCVPNPLAKIEHQRAHINLSNAGCHRETAHKDWRSVSFRTIQSWMSYIHRTLNDRAGID